MSAICPLSFISLKHLLKIDKILDFKSTEIGVIQRVKITKGFDVENFYSNNETDNYLSNPMSDHELISRGSIVINTQSNSTITSEIDNFTELSNDHDDMSYESWFKPVTNKKLKDEEYELTNPALDQNLKFGYI